MIKVRFLNVGKGSCTIIESSTGRLSMIDIDNSLTKKDKDLTDPVDFFTSVFKDKEIFRFILTHPDLDHMSGLDELTQKVSITNFWDTKNNKTMGDDQWEGSPYDKKDWERYLKMRSSQENPKCLNVYRNAASECCWIQDGLKVLSPTEELVELANNSKEDDRFHHLSYVLMLDCGNYRILFGGDASVEAWDSIFKAYKPEELKANIFFAPHHGSKENIHKDAFKAIAPDYVIISDAEGHEYDYDYYSGLAKKKVLSTKFYGDIRVEIDDKGEVTIFLSKNAEK